MKSPTTRLPITRDLTLAYFASLIVVVLLVAVSVAGLVFGAGKLYGDDPTIVQWFRGWDAANLVVGLPILLGTLWLARRGSLIGLLLWPGALYYVLYTYALSVVGAPLNGLFLAYVVLVVLSAYTTIGVVASIDAEAVQQVFAAAPARLVGGVLVGVGVLATAGLTYPVVTTLVGTTQFDALLHSEWVVDYLIGNPVLLVAGVLLWRRESLGFAVGPAVLFLSGMNGVAFAVSGVLGAILAGAPIDVAVIGVHLVIAAVCLAFLTLFLRGGVHPARGEARARDRGGATPRTTASKEAG